MVVWQRARIWITCFKRSETRQRSQAIHQPLEWKQLAENRRYLSWNPHLFWHRTTTHALWPKDQGPYDDTFNVGENPQYILKLSDEAGSDVFVVSSFTAGQTGPFQFKCTSSKPVELQPLQWMMNERVNELRCWLTWMMDETAIKKNNNCNSAFSSPLGLTEKSKRQVVVIDNDAMLLRPSIDRHVDFLHQSEKLVAL